MRITDTTQTFIATLYVIHLLRYEHKGEGSGYPLEIVLFLSLACRHCNAPVEDVKHYFLYCPMYAARRIALFTSAVHLLGDKWLLASDKKKIECFLIGSPDLQFQSNVRLFKQFQSFISNSSRFS